MKPMNINESFEKVLEYCSPRIISSVENCYVKIAKVIGELPWHVHEKEDELFIIHSGSLVMELENELIPLKEGDVYLVKKGTNHRPVATEVCEVILIEKKSTEHTGKTMSEITRSLDDQLRQL